MGDAGIGQLTAIERYAPEAVAPTFFRDVEHTAVGKGEGVLLKQRHVEQVIVLACIGVETHQMES